MLPSPHMDPTVTPQRIVERYTDYGVLGLTVVVFLAFIAILWRAMIAERAQHRAEMKEREEAHAAEVLRKDQALERANAEAHATTREVATKWHDHATSMKSVIESHNRRIGRRE